MKISPSDIYYNYGLKLQDINNDENNVKVSVTDGHLIIDSEGRIDRIIVVLNNEDAISF